MTATKTDAVFLQIINALDKSEAKAIHQIDLANKIGVSIWQIKRIIREARKSGVMIISSKRGYYLSDDKQEIKRFIKMMSKQAAARYGSITKIKKAVTADIDGQITMSMTDTKMKRRVK